MNPEIAGGEYIPGPEEIDLSGVEYRKAAADNAYRTAIAEYQDRKVDQLLNKTFIDWLSKNRFNRILTWSNVYEMYKKLGLVEEV